VSVYVSVSMSLQEGGELILTNPTEKGRPGIDKVAACAYACVCLRECLSVCVRAGGRAGGRACVRARARSGLSACALLTCLQNGTNTHETNPHHPGDICAAGKGERAV